MELFAPVQQLIEDSIIIKEGCSRAPRTRTNPVDGPMASLEMWFVNSSMRISKASNSHV
jgi:hypothetical protein